MNTLASWWLCLMAIAVPLIGQNRSPDLKQEELTSAPRIWTEEKLRDWANPFVASDHRRAGPGMAAVVIEASVMSPPRPLFHRNGLKHVTREMPSALIRALL